MSDKPHDEIVAEYVKYMARYAQKYARGNQKLDQVEQEIPKKHLGIVHTKSKDRLHQELDNADAHRAKISDDVEQWNRKGKVTKIEYNIYRLSNAAFSVRVEQIHEKIERRKDTTVDKLIAITQRLKPLPQLPAWKEKS